MSYRLLTTVIDAASSYDLTTLQNVKDELGLTTTSSDALLARYIGAVSRDVASYCNRVFPIETVADAFSLGVDGASLVEPTDRLQLSRCPIAALTSVVVDGVTLVENTDFKVDAAVGQLFRIFADGCPRAWCGRSIVVTYDAGFDETPAELEDAVIRVVASRFHVKGRDPSIRQESVTGAMEVQYNSGISGVAADVSDVFDNYRLALI